MVGVVSGEAIPPDEHTRRAASYQTQRDQGRVDDDRSATVVGDPPAEEPRQHRVYAADAEGNRRVREDRERGGGAARVRNEGRPTPPRSRAEGASSSEVKSSREMAERSLRQRRRERDRRAERRALRVVFVMFMMIGAAGYFVINSSLLADPEPRRSDPAAGEQESAPAAPAPVIRTSSPIDETPDIPALRSMRDEGLTIVAAGIPDVTAADQGDAVAQIAALETCRFAFGVWEFSANHRFRFLTTCEALEGQVLIGAYEVQGTVVRMSPLSDGATQFMSEFQVEKPSHVTTKAIVRVGDRPVLLVVNQKVTDMRAALAGDAFHDTYAPRNTLQPRGQAKRQ